MRTYAAPPVLELAGASLVRGGAQVLHHMSLAVRAGEHPAILGPNGSGKSSLTRLLTLQLSSSTPDTWWPTVRARPC